MAQKVKVQLETEVSDIPKFCSLNLSETEYALQDAHDLLSDIRSELRNASLEDVKVHLAKIEKIRTLLGKSDACLADIFAILMGYVQLAEKVDQPIENKKESE